LGQYLSFGINFYCRLIYLVWFVILSNYAIGISLGISGDFGLSSGGCTHVIHVVFFGFFIWFQMNCHQTSKSWKVLCWNIRGINSQVKWDALRDRITESQCDIICIQETKRGIFDLSFINKFCHAHFDNFEYLPSVGASGGVITIWKSHLFSGALAFLNDLALLVELVSRHKQPNLGFN
jgi:hypothetical protein